MKEADGAAWRLRSLSTLAKTPPVTARDALFSRPRAKSIRPVDFVHFWHADGRCSGVEVGKLVSTGPSLLSFLALLFNRSL